MNGAYAGQAKNLWKFTGQYQAITKFWSKGAAISGGALLAPSSMASAVEGQPLSCQVAAASDSDQWRTETQQGTAADQVTYSWTSSPSGTGSFSSPSQRTTTWTPSPLADNVGSLSVTLTCRINDRPTAIGASEGGTRDDPAITRQISVTVQRVTVAKVQWRDPSDATSVYQDVGTQPLTVLKGSRLIFKAIPNPSGASWPDGQPTWSGEAAGSGETTGVTFDTISASSSDYRTVTAHCVNSVTVNVLVYELIPYTQGFDVVPGRDESPSASPRYGVGELVNLKYLTQPAGISPDIVWRGDTINNVWAAGEVDYTATLIAEINSGPSRGESRTISRAVVAPTEIMMSNLYDPERVGHNQNSISVGARTKVSILPVDVSFRSIRVAELEAPMIGTGAYSQLTNDPAWKHDRSSDYIDVLAPTNSTDGSTLVGGDRIAYGFPTTQPEPGKDPAGTLAWEIPYVYVVAGRIREHRIGGSGYVVPQVFTITSTGDVSVSKAGYSISANYADPTIYPELTLPQIRLS